MWGIQKNRMNKRILKFLLFYLVIVQIHSYTLQRWQIKIYVWFWICLHFNSDFLVVILKIKEWKLTDRQEMYKILLYYDGRWDKSITQTMFFGENTKILIHIGKWYRILDVFTSGLKKFSWFQIWVNSKAGLI